MSGLFDAAEFEIRCEKCGHVSKKSVAWIKANNGFTCQCGTRTRLDTTQFKSEMANVEKSLKDLKETIRKIGK